MFYERLNLICTEQGFTVSSLVKSLGLSTSKVTAWKNGSLPKQSMLYTLADKLNVQVCDFFIEGTEKEPTAPTLSADEQYIIDVFRSVNKQGQAFILESVDNVKGNARYKKHSLADYGEIAAQGGELTRSKKVTISETTLWDE